MKDYKIVILLICFSLGIVSCSKDDDNLKKEIVGLGGEKWPKSALDDWLYTNFTQPYNLEVKYRWDGTELAADRTLVPIRESLVQTVMETVKTAWVNVYTAEAGEAFVKKYSPKEYILVGSAQYNSNNTITLGEAEGARKITLYKLNDFQKTNRDELKRVLKTVHHEFAHILHQTIMFSDDYKLITPSGYTADWNNKTLQESRNAGFISTYAQSAPEEDFVEMVAIMLTEGKAGYEQILTSASEDGRKLLRKKEEIVYSYFKEVWKIDFQSLQYRATKAMNDVAGSQLPLSSFLGFNKAYTSLTVSPATTPGLSEEFLNIHNTANNGLKAVNTTSVYVLDNIMLVFNSATTMQLRMNFHASAGSASGTSYVANFTYNVAVDGNGNLTFTPPSTGATDGNAGVIANGVVALTDYFRQTAFSLSWKYSDSAPYIYGQLTKSSNVNSFFFGVLGK